MPTNNLNRLRERIGEVIEIKSERKIRLADILLALSIQTDAPLFNASINKYGEFFFPKDEKARPYSLREDNLDNQSQELVDFLCELLGVTNE